MSESRKRIQNEPVEETKKKLKPDFKQSGTLNAAQNTVKGVVLKYAEPPEARLPEAKHRLYVFKGKEQIGEWRLKESTALLMMIDMFHLHRRSAYMFGRERTIVDIPIEHPSCSKQHAVIQHRQITKTNEFGEISKVIKPYLIDLDSTNGTHLNDERIAGSRYIELVHNDVIRFGNSTREYVFIDEDAVDSEKK